MQPITRETIVDRRQPAIRWSAVFGGTAVAAGVWLLLQIFGMGAGLASVDTDHAGSLRGAGIGTSVWSLLAPLIAMFIGGWIAGKLASTRDDKIGGLHGVVVWALTSVLGLMLVVSLLSAIVPRTVTVDTYDDQATAQQQQADGNYHPLAPTHQQLKAADRTGKALLAAGTSMLLSLGTALLGGLLAVRGFGRGHNDPRARRREEHTTMQTGVVPPPPMDTAV